MGLFGLISSNKTNKTNKAIAEATNATNLQIAQETNAANQAINQANLDWARESLDLEQAFTQSMYEQELADSRDYAAIREAYEEAGYNPNVMVSGGSSVGSSSVPSTGSPHANSPSMIPNQSAQMQSYQAIPYDLDLSGIVSLGQSIKSAKLDNEAKELQNQNLQLSNEYLQYEKELDLAKSYSAIKNIDIDSALKQVEYNINRATSDYTIERSKNDAAASALQVQKSSYETDLAAMRVRNYPQVSELEMSKLASSVMLDKANVNKTNAEIRDIMADTLLKKVNTAKSKNELYKGGVFTAKDAKDVANAYMSSVESGLRLQNEQYIDVLQKQGNWKEAKKLREQLGYTPDSWFDKGQTATASFLETVGNVFGGAGTSLIRGLLK